MDGINILKNEAMALSSQIIEWRRELHRIPEVGLYLPQTREHIIKCLTAMGAEYKALSASSSILVRIKGSLPGPAVGLRADMDALPIAEKTGLTYAGENGNMHACGHDAHCAMLLGAIKLLLSRKDKLCGEVKCLFQAGEETGQGAASAVAEGVWDAPTPEAMFVLHVANSIPQVRCGEIGVKDGVVMAASDAFIITLHGRGGHISDLEKLLSPVWPVGDICAGARNISEKWITNRPKALLAISCLNAGECFNALPDTATLKGAIRSMDNDARAAVKEELTQLCRRVEEESHCWVELYWESSNDCLNNEKHVTDIARETAHLLFPGEVKEITTEILASEDVFHLFNKSPGSYIHLGCGFEDGRENYPLHNGRFCLNEEILWKGTAMMAACAVDWRYKWIGSF